MLYVWFVPTQGAALPTMLPGCAGTVFTVTGSVEGAEIPQAFVTVTLTAPLVLDAVVVRELVLEVPVQPAGVVQL
jgi:hypothetical protein